MRLPMCLCEMGVGLQAINLHFNSSSESSVSHMHYSHDTTSGNTNPLKRGRKGSLCFYLYGNGATKKCKKESLPNRLVINRLSLQHLSFLPHSMSNFKEQFDSSSTHDLKERL